MRGLLLTCCCLLTTGCAAIRDCCNEDCLYWRMCFESHHVWAKAKPYYRGEPCFAEFKRGFKDGYVSVGMGTSPCPPTLPPKDYWNPAYRSDEGRAKIAAWYNGYAAGASTAWTAGLQERNRLPTKVEFYGCCESRPDCPENLRTMTDSPADELEPPPVVPVTPQPIPDQPPRVVPEILDDGLGVSPAAHRFEP